MSGETDRERAERIKEQVKEARRAERDKKKFEKRVAEEVNKRLDRATQLTPGQLQAAADAGRLRDDLLNVEPLHPGNNRGAGKFLPSLIVDGHFRDRRNNILNSGNAFHYTALKYRWFIDGAPNTPPIFTETPLPRPTLDISPAARLLMVPIGIVSDRMEPRWSKKDKTIRAGQIAYLRVKPTFSPSEQRKDWNVVDASGSYCESKFVWLTGGVTEAQYRTLATEAVKAYREELVTIRNAHQRELVKWGKYQRNWEWELFGKAREKFDQIIWPRGTTREMVDAANREEVIRMFPIESWVKPPGIAPKTDEELAYEMMVQHERERTQATTEATERCGSSRERGSHC
jgi:hypothetical protein